MKTKTTIILLFSILLITACTGVRSASGGLENEAFLNFVGEPKKYPNDLTVNIDDKITFSARVNKQNQILKGNIYSILPGKHIISVSHNNQVIYRKQLFISAQETRNIILP